MPFIIKRVKHQDLLKTINQNIEDLIDLKNGVADTIDDRKSALEEIKERMNSSKDDPESVASYAQAIKTYEEDIVHFEKHAIVVDAKIKRMDMIDKLPNTACFCISQKTTLPEMKYLIAELESGIKNEKKEENKLFLNAVYEIAETCKERLASGVSLPDDVYIPLLGEELNQGNKLVESSFIEHFNKANSKEKYAILIHAIENNDDHKLDGLINRISEDKAFIAHQEIINIIKQFYPLLKSIEHLSGNEVDILKKYKDIIDTVIATKMHLSEGPELMKAFKTTTHQFINDLSKKSGAFSFGFKDVINWLCKLTDHEPIFKMTAAKRSATEVLKKLNAADSDSKKFKTLKEELFGKTDKKLDLIQETAINPLHKGPWNK